MKTAKQICEEIKERNLKSIIEQVNFCGGQLKSTQDRIGYNNKIIKDDNIKYINSILTLKPDLEALGFKVTESVSLLEYEEVKLTGFLFTEKSEIVKKSVQTRTITVSACCGE